MTQPCLLRADWNGMCLRAVETFKDVPQLGRFTLRDEGRTIAIGKVLRLSQKQENQMTSEEDAKMA